ncbi:hypothetical protein ANCCAN_15902 [Ancylostoma caninum]|uniref:Uncharacterized protein n=1 Tax=Ancylostoma caninum TaxID=29170 RepID=A0A368G3B2_ANCCA|nr:hypothetical protein ANCCAN_15902 [Ancylostoma caninum]
MWTPSLLFLTMLSYAVGDVRVQKAKYGDRVTLQVETDVKEWMRVKSDGTKEYVQYCGDAVGLGCNMFADDSGRASCPSSSVTVFPNGTLTLHFLWEGDAFAKYSASDATPGVEQENHNISGNGAKKMIEAKAELYGAPARALQS